MTAPRHPPRPRPGEERNRKTSSRGGARSSTAVSGRPERAAPALTQAPPLPEPALPMPTWYELLFPWEEPRWFHGKLRWRRRHERIAALEADVLGIRRQRLPWESIGY